MKRVGVFVCHCGMNIAGVVNVPEVVEFAKTLPGVVTAQDYKYMCSDQGAGVITKAIEEYNLESVVVASCSPRMHEPTFKAVIDSAGMNPYCMDMANIRDQCSWVHMGDKKAATEKAKVLVRMSVAKARLLEPLEKTTVKVIPEALVIGAGIAGIQASLDLADGGFKVHLVERSPTIGGRMAQLDKTFPTLDCSSCILTPKMMDVARHPNINLMTYSEVRAVNGSVGNFKVKVEKKARYVDVDKCTGCNACAEACRLAGRVPKEFDMGRGKRAAVYVPFPQSVPMKYTVDDKHCLMITKGKCGKGPLCVEACEANAINFEDKPEEVELNVGAIILATGYDVMDASKMYEYGYGQSEDVMTTLELERLLSAHGPTNGEFVKLSDGEKPKSVSIFLCVGSRDESLYSHCCRIGCMSALKHAYLIREKDPDIEINICYTDVRAFGKGYEEFYMRVRGLNINMIRGRPSEVYVMPDGVLKYDVFDTMTGKLLEVLSDMVVLAPALTPRADVDEVARLFRISRSADGFFLEAHPKLKPMDTLTGGIFITGACQGPKDIPDTIAQASGAAARAATILSKGDMEIDPLIAAVDAKICSGCGLCVSACPFSAIELEDDGKAVVNTALCKGCGVCCATCRAGAIQQNGFKDEQLLATIKSTFNEVF